MKEYITEIKVVSELDRGGGSQTCPRICSGAGMYNLRKWGSLPQETYPIAYLLVPGTQHCLSLQVQSKAVSPSSLTSLLNAAYLAPYLCRQAPCKLGLEQVWGIGWLTNELRQLSVGWGGSDPLLCNYMCLGEMSGPEGSRRLNGLTCCPGFVQLHRWILVSPYQGQ